MSASTEIHIRAVNAGISMLGRVRDLEGLRAVVEGDRVLERLVDRELEDAERTVVSVMRSVLSLDPA
ncbi:hypothetical protein [Agromyces humi]|uniref:hypothetical protein n=1 Tax=Agromyces humi TaxID=1766800 RepID=UPI001356BA07|nr:hypothetical protein [Agromyces humi]